MTKILFRGATVFDGHSETLLHNRDVLVENGTITQVVSHGLPTEGADVVECAGRVLMPGMIDAHTHIYAASLSVSKMVAAPSSYIAHYAAGFMRHSLDCGFTTIRDTGGGDIGAAHALRDGLVAGPRLFYGGRALSQTGGHGEGRSEEHDAGLCGCSFGHSHHFAMIADGIDAVRAATREQLRRGATHIKIMASGGVTSPNDPLLRSQYSDGEIEAIVDEADRWGTYVAAHCHPAHAVRRCVDLGVRTIEHGSLIDRPTAEFVVERDAFVVPTLAVAFAYQDDGLKLGLEQASYDKLQHVIDKMLNGLRVMSDAGVKMGFGTDLLGPHSVRQCTEFTLRAQVIKPIEILRSACSINADILQQKGRLGCIAPGAEADLLLVDGNPLEDISLLAADGANLSVILTRGRFHKRTVATHEAAI